MQDKGKSSEEAVSAELSNEELKQITGGRNPIREMGEIQ